MDAPQPDGRRASVIRLLRLALDLGADTVGGAWTADELELAELARQAPASSRTDIATARDAILRGSDPLGGRLCELWSAADRRSHGVFYTDPVVVEPMLDWVMARGPERLVDPGCGSGRFAASAIRRRPDLPVVAVDLDPVATVLTRATLAAVHAQDATVLQTDYTNLVLPAIAGRTAFVGNPPYVRHHDLSTAAKSWAVAVGRQLGQRVSSLAGLHAHFYLATALYAKPGDIGCFVTSSEWLDVGYGSIIRSLLLDGLGATALHVIDPRAIPFADAMVTAAIACFEVGTVSDGIRVRRVESPAALASLELGEFVDRDALTGRHRWSPLLQQAAHHRPDEDWISLGDIARVHRGAVTGANGFFVLSPTQARAHGIEAWCRPVISGAKEILDAGGIVKAGPRTKLLLDVPADADRASHPQLDAYLKLGEVPRDDQPPISTRYVTSRRRPWWNLGLAPPPPIVATYMTRQAPAFALNPDGLAVINIAHGIYPTRPLTDAQLVTLVTALNQARASFRGSGRTYYGGLEKFEPGEMEALPVPMHATSRR